ncbi:uncharacterized protein LOC118732528, partial [Rhagoletis pomonella]|uniref:uncharacterized protein LOC118732528 n=1 Tax=Rhagoletis pomonella TaxID=28610 RepID=UPI0017863F09
FKKMGQQSEPDLPRVPEGDVHLKHIATVDGEEVEDSIERGKRKLEVEKVQRKNRKETRNEMKPLRLLPTEFYEALPTPIDDQMKRTKGNNWNALLFPEPFSKKETKTNTLDEASVSKDADADVEKVGATQFQTGGQLAEDFLLAQEELARSFLHENEEKGKGKEHTNDKIIETNAESEDEMLEKIKSLRTKYIDYLAENLENYFNERGAEGDIDAQIGEPTTEAPWWNLSSLRKRRSPRALRNRLSEDDWISNMITKDEDLEPLGSTTPEQLMGYERKAPRRLQTDEEKHKGKSNAYLRTMKNKVGRLVEIVTQHVNEWYNTITKPVGDTNGADSNRLRVTRGKRRN